MTCQNESFSRKQLIIIKKKKKVELDSFNDIKKIYIDIIEKTTGMEKHARWKKGMHPAYLCIFLHAHPKKPLNFIKLWELN